MDFFEKNDFELIKKWENTKYDKVKSEHVSAFNDLKKVYEKLEYWATSLNEAIGLSFELSIRKNPVNQAAKFESYLWCKLVPKNTDKVRVAITPVITQSELVLKIDRIGDLKSREKNLFDEAAAAAKNKKISYKWKLNDFDGTWDSCFIKSKAAIEGLVQEFSYFQNKVNRIGLVSSVIWNSNGWTADPTDEDMKHSKGFEHVEEYNMANESINFAHTKYKTDAEGYYYGYSPQMNKLPSVKDIEIIVLVSRDYDNKNKIVGYYKNPLIENFDKGKVIKGENIYKKYHHANFKSKVADIYVLEKPLYFDEELYLPDQKEKAKQRFNYIDGFCIDKILKAIHGEATHMENNGINESTSKNSILFGPPGVGKTYSSISKAVSIANPQFSSTDRASIKKEYDRLSEAGQIVFTTFHQSMSYEDFIEGIKPHETKGGGISYTVKPGIFREICKEASFSNDSLLEEDAPQEVVEFSLAYDSFLESVRERLAKNELVELESKSGGKVIVDRVSGQDNFLIKHPEGVRVYSVSKYRLSKLFSAYSDLSMVSNVSDQFKEVIGGSNSSAYWSVLNAVIDFLKKNKVEKKPPTKTTKKNYVLIIDEINRGNISQIFGELITLIEDNKRIGESEELKVMLPYSKGLFGVPNNLHIIGTMNTADRSVEALDTALRRRFCFEEIHPNPELVRLEGKVTGGLIGNVDLAEVLSVINSRIELLMDKDHMIGHSYFMNVSNLQDLKQSFQKSIIPLLQEYFYGDFGKIGLVIGSGFFENRETKSLDSADVFANFNDYDSVELGSKPIYRLLDVNKFSEKKMLDALSRLLRKT